MWPQLKGPIKKQLESTQKDIKYSTIVDAIFLGKIIKALEKGITIFTKIAFAVQHLMATW